MDVERRKIEFLREKFLLLNFVGATSTVVAKRLQYRCKIWSPQTLFEATVWLKEMPEAEVSGVAGDAFHLTQPAEDGIGGLLSMQRCLIDAHVNASEVTYVNAHATSTPAGDRAEARAIAKLIPGVAVSSIKGSMIYLSITSV